MSLISEAELQLEQQAQRAANDAPMDYHADSCPYLISNRRRHCQCNCFSSALSQLRQKLPSKE